MTVQVIHEKCELGKAEDKKLPSDSFVVSYNDKEELKYDIVRASAQVDVFDHYYDTYKNVQQISGTKGIVSPRTYDNTSNKSSPPKKRKKKV